MVVVEQKILNVNDFSPFFPGELGSEIRRDNLIDGLDNMLKKNSIVIMNGESGTGKTILLKQFCEKNNCISIFISPMKPISSSLDLILESVIKQIVFLTKGQVISELPSSTPQLEIRFNRELGNLYQFASQGNSVYFIVDGLYHVSLESDYLIEKLFREILSFGRKNLKIIISKTDDDIRLDRFIHEINSTKKELSMIGLTSEEVGTIFSELQLDASIVEEIRSHFKGNPSDIVELSKIIKSKHDDIESIINELPDDMFDYTWQKIDTSNNYTLEMLALIIYSNRELSQVDLSHLLNLKSEKIDEIICDNPLIHIVEDRVTLANETYLNQLMKKLESLKKQTFIKLAGFIVSNEMKTDYWLLVKYYEESENYRELFNILDDPDYVDSIAASHSLGSLKMLVESGLRASGRIDNLPNLFKYSLENSLVKSRTHDSKKNEIEALMSLKQEHRAISVAKNLKLIEDRLLSLAVIARIEKKSQGTVNQTLLDEINKLYNMVDFEYIGSKGIEIASELISVDVDLSIQILEKSFDFEGDENSLDKIMVALSLESLLNEKDTNYELVESIKKRVKDPEVKDAFATMFNFSKSIPPKYLIEEVSKIELLNARINFLVNWCEENDGNDSRLEIVKFAFKQLSSSSEYKSNTSLYFKISKQLLFDKAPENLEIIEMFDSRIEMLEKNGPTVFYVRILINIINSIDKIDTEECANRIEKLYNYIECIEDSATKLECQSYFFTSCVSLENIEKYQEKLLILGLLQEEIKEELNDITENFAYQEELLSKSLKILVSTDYEFCCETVEKVNTITNREELYKSLIEGLIEDKAIENLDCNLIDNMIIQVLKICDNFTYNRDYFDNSIDGLLQALYYIVNEKKVQVSIPDNTVKKILSYCYKIRESHQKIRSIVLLISIFRDSELLNEENEYKNVVNLWNKIDVFPRKINIGYEIVTILSDHNSILATDLGNKITNEKLENGQFESDEFWPLVMLVRLLIQSFKGVINHTDSYSEISIYSKKISSIIDSVSSNGEKSILKSNLVSILSNKGDFKSQQKLVTDITKHIDSIPREDARYRAHVIKKCAPTLYKNSRSYFNEAIKIMSPSEIDDCYAQLCIYFLTKTDSFQPFEFTAKSNYKCSYEDVLEAINILSSIEQDSMKYSLLKIILDMIKDKKGPNLNQERKNDLKVTIENLIEKSFVSGNFIRHQGFKILARYYHWITFNSFQKDKIAHFLAEIKNIPNLSDRVFCQISIAAEIKRPKDSELRDQILDDAEKSIDQLSSTSEKILRYEDMAEAVHQRKNSKEKIYIEKALELIDGTDDKNSRVEKRLIDLAHQLDSDFANSLVSSIKEGSIEEKNQKKRYQRRIEDLSLSEKVTNDKGAEEFSNIEYQEASKLCNICWECLSQLLAGSISARKPNQLKNYLKVAARLAINQSYPIYSWFLENVVQKNNKNTAFDFFEATHIACKFALLNRIHSGKHIQEIEEYFDEYSSSLLVKEGMEEDAINFISDKLSTQNLDTIVICDPYFDKNDLRFLFLLYNSLDCEKVEFTVLTSLKQIKSNSEREDFSEEFLDYWKAQISSENPPYTIFTAAGIKGSNDSPFHDRYILGEKAGVQIGGSINGLGKKKDMVITELSEEIVQKMNEYFNNFFSTNLKYFRENNVDLSLVTFGI